MTGEAIRERLTPALDTLQDTMRQGRHTLVRGRHAAEDAAASAARSIRRRPLGATAVAAAAGVLVGAVIGGAFGWLAGRRS
jgi:ElaB/YqjD/DUF883 family membrane-anchored ribosome-binding protein